MAVALGTTPLVDLVGDLSVLVAVMHWGPEPTISFDGRDVGVSPAVHTETPDGADVGLEFGVPDCHGLLLDFRDSTSIVPHESNGESPETLGGTGNPAIVGW